MIVVPNVTGRVETLLSAVILIVYNYVRSMLKK